MAFVLVLFLIVSFEDQNGKVDNTEVVLDYLPDNISKEEAYEAIGCIKEYFSLNFKGCNLLIVESTEKSNSENQELSARYENDKIITFNSNFSVDKTGVDGSLIRDCVYTEWRWVVIKNTNGDWEVAEYGVL